MCRQQHALQKLLMLIAETALYGTPSNSSSEDFSLLDSNEGALRVLVSVQHR